MSPRLVEITVKRGRTPITVAAEVVHEGPTTTVVRLCDGTGWDDDHKDWQKGFLQFVPKKEAKPMEVPF